MIQAFCSTNYSSNLYLLSLSVALELNPPLPKAFERVISSSAAVYTFPSKLCTYMKITLMHMLSNPPMLVCCTFLASFWPFTFKRQVWVLVTQRLEYVSWQPHIPLANYSGSLTTWVLIGSVILAGSITITACLMAFLKLSPEYDMGVTRTIYRLFVQSKNVDSYSTYETFKLLLWQNSGQCLYPCFTLVNGDLIQMSGAIWTATSNLHTNG